MKETADIARNNIANDNFFHFYRYYVLIAHVH